MSGMVQVSLAALLISMSGVSVAQTVGLTNDSDRDYPTDAFWVGDWFTVTVNGAPNKLVTMDATWVGNGTFNWELGTTNSNGVLQFSAQIAQLVGHWIEVVNVDGATASPTLEFDIVPPPPTPCSFHPDPITFFNGHMGSTDFYNPAGVFENTQRSAQPQQVSHYVVSGPCRHKSTSSSTGFAKATAQLSSYDSQTQGYQQVNWTVIDNDPLAIGSFGRCHWLVCNPGYPFYEEGSVHTVFENVEHLPTVYLLTTDYSLEIHACDYTGCI